VRVEAERTLLAAPEEVWALLAEPYHLSDWWPGYSAVRPDRRGVSEGARWTVVRGLDPGFLRKPGGEGTIVIGPVNQLRSLAWRDIGQAFTAEIRVEPAADGLTRAAISLEAPWWRIYVEGLRDLPRRALVRLHDLCQTAASL
jgi:Polyketide cyclase / dehydrase and lipid transport